MLLHVTHHGVTFREHNLVWKCACIQPQLISPLRRLSAGTSALRHQHYSALTGEKGGDENTRNGGQVCPPPTHRQIDRRNRQTGSTMADSPCNLLIRTRQSRHHRQTVQRTVQYCSSGVVITPPSSLNTQSVRVATNTRTYFFSTQKILVSHDRARGETPTTSLALGANPEGKGRVKGKATRIHSS